MMNGGFQPPETIGGKLEEFTSEGLQRLIAAAICGEDNLYGERCDGECTEPYCPGYIAMGHLENQIGEAGIEFMTQLIRDWVAA